MSIARVDAAKLHKQLFIGIDVNGSIVKDYSLLRSNGVSEKIFVDKAGSKPYTWMANVLSVAIDQIGTEKVGGPTRSEYMRTGSVTHHPLVLRMPINDANSALIDVHRTVWKNLLKNQDVVCKYCAHEMHIDIDLDRIVFLPENRWKLDREWQEIVVNLPSGYTYEGLPIVGKPGEVAFSEYVGQVFNRMIFRVPTLADGIRLEKLMADPIPFWRRMANDCLQSIQAVSLNKDGEADDHSTILAEMPPTLRPMLGMKLFDELLFADDLDAIRVALREDPPTYPFYYREECANASCRRDTDIVIEASAFFSV